MCNACYIHVPFCQEICAYCDFTRCRYHFGLVERWLDKIQQELKETLKQGTLKTIYIGGGTPSALSKQQLETLLIAIYPYINAVEEYTMEANVESFDIDKMQICKQYGVNRISLGVQSLQPEILSYIHRQHNAEDIKRCLTHLHEVGIHNISVDMIYGLPNQTLFMWQEDLSQLAQEYAITHISLYALTIEQHSEFGRNHVEPCDPDLEADMYEYALQYLSQTGFPRYEISNFAKKGYESKHNQMYWDYEDFYGIGMGASGKRHHMRYDNTKNMETYFQKGSDPKIIELKREDEMFEMMMMSLRLERGLCVQRFYDVFQEDVLTKFHDQIETNIQNQMLLLENGYLKATSKGFLLLNDLLIQFLPDSTFEDGVDIYE